METGDSGEYQAQGEKHEARRRRGADLPDAAEARQDAVAGAERLGQKKKHAGKVSGQGGIRTHDTLAGIPVFETGSFSHSDTCPGRT